MFEYQRPKFELHLKDWPLTASVTSDHCVQSGTVLRLQQVWKTLIK